MPKDLKFVFQSKEQIHNSQYQDISRYDFTTPDGDPKSFEIHELGGTSVILALTPDNQVVTVTQYRPGPQQVLTELPAWLCRSWRNTNPSCSSRASRRNS